MSGEIEGHQERTEGGSGTHHAVLERPDLEDFLVDGEECDGPAEQDGEEVERDGGEEDVLTSEEADPLKEGGERISPALSCGFDNVHGGEENEEDESGTRLQSVDEGILDLISDEESGECGSGDRGELEASAVPGDGIGEDGARDDERHQGGLGRLLECAGGTVEEEAEVHPFNGPAEPGDDHQSEGTESDDSHRELDDFLTGVGVGELTCREREEEDRQELDESDDGDTVVRGPETADFVDAGEDFVADGGGLHLHAQDGDEAA